MAIIDFCKMHGLGNDYLYVDLRDGRYHQVDWPQLALKICDRHFGVGADGVITIGFSERADARMIIYNADGSRSEMCGNGLRALSKWLFDHGWSGKNQIIETDAGLLYPEVVEERDGRAMTIRVNMGAPQWDPRPWGVTSSGTDSWIDRLIPLTDTNSIVATFVSMGNPHLVTFGPLWDIGKMGHLGPQLERHGWFPQRVNVHSVEVIDAHHLSMRHWERGAGQTLACGTGVAGAAAAAIRQGLAHSPLTITVPGGELLAEWGGKSTDPVFLTGPAEEVFSGTYAWDESITPA